MAERGVRYHRRSGPPGQEAVGGSGGRGSLRYHKSGTCLEPQLFPRAPPGDLARALRSAPVADRPRRERVLRWLRSPWLRLAIGPALLAAILASLDRRALLDAFRSAGGGLLVAAYLAPLPAIALRALRWKLLLGEQARPWAFGELLGFYARSISAGVLTPGRLGEFAKVALVARRGTRTATALWSTVLDRVSDLAFLAVLAAGSLPLVALAPVEGRAGVWVAAAAAVGGAAGLWALGATRRGEALRGRVLRAARRRLGRETSEADPVRAAPISLAPRAALATVALTAASWALTYLANYLFSLSLGLPLGYLEIAGISAVCSLVASLPISIAGAGTRDATLILILARYGVGSTHAVALSALMLSGVLWVGAVCAVSFLFPASRAGSRGHT